MKHTFKVLPKSIREVEVTFDDKEFLEYYKPVYDSEVSGMHLKGFRPGTAPKELVDKFIDKEKVFEHAAEHAVRDALKQIVKENNFDVIDQPQIEIVETKEGMKFKASLVVFPEIKMGNYKKIAKKTFEDKKEVKVTEDEIKKAIEWVVKSRAKIEKVEREAKKGDVVDVVVAGKRDHFILGEGKIKDGKEEKIIGHKAGEKFDDVEIVAVYDRKVSELNDEFAKTLGNFKTVEEFKKSVVDGLQKEKEEQEKEKLRMKMMEAIIKDSKIDMPEVLVERMAQNMVEDYKHHLHHIKEAPKDEELLAKLRPLAETRVSSSLILHQISKEENLEPSKEEVEEEVNKTLKTLHPTQAAQIDPQRVYDYSYDIIKNKKVFDFLESQK